ncbi:WD40 repeat-containing protein [Cavenderia fasciculata]|uniref:WD40 repeat-containing protein n=1 Tax=Cavenderia fasciculata TaxID=261658 RepID=F4Q586_CACFS|nr:WD40 repeat-containing protein [Cavenderia fasciculata]EGG17145.1 WD40 repeat-containing protein [Cavenderia fasciculata]|eukprot:XP_004355629.1 WD40 repeat-containing protein [Cavenderia fasciculata]
MSSTGRTRGTLRAGTPLRGGRGRGGATPSRGGRGGFNSQPSAVPQAAPTSATERQPRPATATSARSPRQRGGAAPQRLPRPAAGDHVEDDVISLTQSQFFSDLQTRAFAMLDQIQLREKKLELINIVSSSLIKEPRFNKVTPALENIITNVYHVAYFDPEFILKLSLYTRQELGIRTVANYLMALASVIPPCQPYLKKYYQSTIRLPSDWLEIPNITNKLLSSKTIPKSLRNVMVDKFTDFDTYQLGKYNTEGKIKRNRKKLKSLIKKNPEQKDRLTKEFEEKQTGSLKQMIRVLHISKPNYSIMCILGKKYPLTYEDYQKTKLPGDFEAERAGTRMKLPIPETWETMLSEKGNKSTTWTELIDANKLPFMAMLRNLRNLLITGCHARVHDNIIRMLSNRVLIGKQNTFPMQFLAAYNSIPTDVTKLRALATEKNIKTEFFPPADLLDRYRQALDNAIKLSTIINVKPISGTTVVFVYVGGSSGGNSRDPHASKYTQLDNALLLGLMCQFVCEECEVILIGKDKLGNSLLHPIEKLVDSVYDQDKPEEESTVSEDDSTEVLGDSILAKMESIKKTIEQLFDADANDNLFPTDYIMNSILKFIAQRGAIDQQLQYVEKIDELKKLKSITINTTQTSSGETDNKNNPSTIILEKKKKEETVPLVGNVANYIKPWRNIRVFISSTFLDMHGERNQMVKHIFPELRERCAKRKIHISEIDLRWGITEDEAQKNRSVELCLDEVDRCRPFFIGLLGQRYGWVPTNYKLSEEPRYDWIRNYPKGRSITELEMIHATNLCNTSTGINSNCLFYIRNPVAVPKELKTQFECEDSDSAGKLESLKTKIKQNCNYYTYSPRAIEVVDNQAQTIGLEEFSERVLEDLWSKIVEQYPDTQESDEAIDEMKQQDEQEQVYRDLKTKSFVGRKDETNCLYKFCDVIRPFGTSPKAGLTDVDVSAIPTDYKQLKIYLQVLLKKASVKANIYLFIDGIDQLENKFNAKSLDWIPNVSPVKTIITSVDGDHSVSILKRRKGGPLEVTVDPMDARDSQTLVTTKLADYRKRLDESVTNNQMKMLMNKADASNPLYLVLACEELRYFGGFQELTDKIKSLSPTLAVLFQDILTRLETDSGKLLIGSILGSIASSRIGLTEMDLRVLSARRELGEELLPIGIWSKIFRSIQSLVQVNGDDQTIDFFHNQMKLAVVKKYLTTSDSTERIHKQFATFYMERADPQANQTYHGADPKALSEIVYHHYHSKQTAVLESILCNLNFVEQKCKHGMTSQLLLDYLLVIGGGQDDGTTTINFNATQQKSSGSMSSAKAKQFSIVSNITDFFQMLSTNAHILSKSPQLVFQQAMNQPSTSHAHKVAKLAEKINKKSWVEWNNKPETRDSCIQTISGFGQGTTAVAWAPNGQMMAVAAKDSSIRLLGPTGAELLILGEGHTDWVSSLSFSKDGKTLVSGGLDNKIVIWDVVVGSALHILDRGHDRSVTSVRFSPVDANLFASVGLDGRLVMWNLSTHSYVKMIYAHDKPVNHCAFTKDGTMIATCSWDGSIKIWNVANLVNNINEVAMIINSNLGKGAKRVNRNVWLPNNVIDVSTQIKGSLKSCEFSPSAKQMIATAMDGSVLLFDIASSKLLSVIGRHSKSANYCSFSEDGEQFVTSSDDSSLKVWTPTLGCELGQIKMDGDAWANCMVWSPKNNVLAVGCSDCIIRLYEVIGNSFKLVAKLPQSHTRAITSVALSGNERWLASTSEDKAIVVWNIAERSVEYYQKDAHIEVINCLAFNPTDTASDTTTLISCSDDYRTNIWRWNGTKLSPITHLPGSTNTIKSCTFSPNGKYIATVSRDCSITIYLAASYKEVGKCLGHTDWVNFCTFAPDSKRIVSGGWDFNIKVWSMNSKKELLSLKGHTGSIERAFFTNDLKYIVSCSFDNTIKIWDPEFGSEITTLHHQSRISDVVQLGDGTGRILSSSDDGLIKCWNPTTGQCVMTLTGHSSSIPQSIFAAKNDKIQGSANKKLITSTSNDGSVKIWELAPQAIPSQAGDSVVQVALSLDGSLVAVVRKGLSTEVYDTKTHAIVKTIRSFGPAPSSVAFTLEGKLVIGCEDGQVVVYAKDLLTSQVFKVHNEKVSAIAPFQQFDTFVTGSWDTKVHLWSEKATNQLCHLSDWVECLAFSGDGECIASAGRSNQFTMTTPNLSSTTLRSMSDTKYITSLAFSPNSKLLAIGTFEGNVEIFNLEKKQFQSINTSQKDAISSIKFIDNRHIVSASKDTSLIVYNIEKEEIENEFIHNSPITSMDCRQNKIVTGDSNGNTYYLLYHPSK